jgi:transglutaminase-like putative cysteine protease
MLTALNSSPPVKFAPFLGPRTTIDEMIRSLNGQRGERSVRVRSFTEEAVRGLQPKDYLSEILAIRYAVGEKIRYLNDPLTTEWVKDPERLVEEIQANGTAAADCDEIALLTATMLRQVGRDADFVTVGFGAPGSHSHVFARAKEPKSGIYIVCDPVAGTNEEQMLARVTSFKIWRTN